MIEPSNMDQPTIIPANRGEKILALATNAMIKKSYYHDHKRVLEIPVNDSINVLSCEQDANEGEKISSLPDHEKNQSLSYHQDENHERALLLEEVPANDSLLNISALASEQDMDIDSEILLRCADTILEQIINIPEHDKGPGQMFEDAGDNIATTELNIPEPDTIPEHDEGPDNIVTTELNILEPDNIPEHDQGPDNIVTTELNIPEPDTIPEHKEGPGQKRNKKPVQSKWMKTQNKRKREMGDEYLGVQKLPDGNGWIYDKIRPAKKLKPHCDCKLSQSSNKINCAKFTDDIREIIFHQFWKVLTWEQRRVYVVNLIDSNVPKDTKNRKNDNSRRANSLVYHLKLEGCRERVCKTLFLNTLGLTDWVILDWMKKHEGSSMLENRSVIAPSTPTNDNKLNTSTPGKKRRIVDCGEKRSTLKEFLKSLPKLESHYCRKTSNKLYLEAGFQSKAEVYKLYKEECEKTQKACASIKTFHDEFDSQNLGIFSPRKDQCDICSSYKVGNKEEVVYLDHVKRKTRAREEKENDNKDAKFVFTVDMQAVLLAPSLKASAIYYKTKLMVHNFTIFDNKSKEGYCFVWHEGEGGVSSNEFASIISHFLLNLDVVENDTVIFWSDGCGYQNRNVTLSNVLLNVAEEKKIVIIQKYLERGHTQMECDSMHATIERSLKNKEIYSPANYVEIFKQARKNPKPYNVEYLDHSFFKDFSASLLYTSVRPGSTVGDPKVNDVRAYKYTPEKEMFYKISFDDEWKPLPKRRSRKQFTNRISLLYNEIIKINPKKFGHLQELKEVLPKDYHYFYDNLKH